MNEVFSLPFMRFDHIPDDSELVCLLGDSACPGKIAVIETSESIVARPWLFPMKFVVPWMLFVAAMITAIPWIARYFGSRMSGVEILIVIVGTWLFALPGFLGLTVLINHVFAKKGDYFRVDKLHRTLELPQVHKTITASEILAFTEIFRWYRWDATRQAGVLVKTPDGQCILYPMFRELEENGYKQGSQLMALLVQIFRVPVRQVTLNKQESKALKDC